ncbi:MAG: translation initiation factor IF-2 [Candidatus Omnitrophota bacterium]
MKKEKEVKKKRPVAKAAEVKPKTKKVAAKTASVKKKAPVKKVIEKEAPVLKAAKIEVKKEAPKVSIRPQAPVTPTVTVKKEVPPAPKPVMPPKPIPAEKPLPPKPVQKAAPAAPVIKEKAAPPPPPKPELKPPPPPEVKIEVKPQAAEPPKPRILEFEVPISLKDLALKIGVRANELILKLMAKNIMVTITQNIAEDLVENILKEYNIEYRKPAKVEEQVAREHMEAEEKQDLQHIVSRPPVVTFMGHVDHGKTSLLDFIRKTRVADKEKGGITQHIGAYEAKIKKGSVTFLDTPGHEAFTAMRARGANATDVVVLVVAADDGIMPQTKEAIDHARAAGVPIVVAINKCDLPSANIEKVKGQLSQVGLSPEGWGGKTITVPVSAKTGEGVDALLEMLLLESELLELKANPHLRARGVVIEGKLSSGQGPVATVLVKNGTLKVGDMVLSGMHYGRVKAMMDHTGKRISEAPPSKPVSILGLSGVPMAGDEFFAVKDERKARTLSLLKQDEARTRKMKLSRRVTLEDFYKQMKNGAAKELAIILKGDVQGSIEALQQSLMDMGTSEVKVHIIHSDVGNINESDIMLAMVSNAVIMGFNVRVDEGAEALAAKEDIEIKLYGIIYEAIQDVMAAMEGLLEPFSKEVFLGRAVVKQVFKVSKAGTIAGCSVVKGKIARSGLTKLIRNKEVIYQGKIASLKRFKDDARDVAEGFECGIGLDRHDDIREGDIIEQHQIEKVARRLEARK